MMGIEKLPSNWCVSSLAEIARPIGGSTPSKSDPSLWENGTVPWVSPKDMKVFGLHGSEDAVSETALKRLTLIPPDSVLVVVRSGILSRILPVAINHLAVTINQDMRGFVPEREINARFIAWQLLANQRDILGKCSKDGTTVASIEALALASFPLALPPANEQHRIVAKIEELFSELDQGVASLKTAREQLKVYRQSLLKNAFAGKLTAAWRAAHADQLETAAALQQRIASERTDRHRQQLADWQARGQQGPKPKPPKPLPPLTPEELAELPELPAGWGWLRLEGLVSGVDQGWSPKCDGRPAEENEWAVIKTTAIQHGRFDDFENKALPPGLSPRAQHELQSGDILVTRAGPRVRVGVCCLVRSVRTKLMNCDKAYRIRALSSLCSPLFLESVLNSPRVLDVLERIKSGINDSGVNLNQGAFLSLAVPVCSLSEQAEVIADLEFKLSEADQLDQTLATALQQAEALRQSILKKAFCGQLIKQDKNDEPATALLERIRAEKPDGMKISGKRGKSS
ncbi:MAG: restriction endonuclease subunit S [Chromatiaceae bacterium]|nr:restriction endonuclease subunit S [Chromatiaceae bacterium]